MDDEQTELVPAWHVTIPPKLTVRPTTPAPGFPALCVAIETNAGESRLFVSCEEFRAWAARALEVVAATELALVKPDVMCDPPTPAQLREVFGPGFTGGPGIVGKRDGEAK